MGWKQSMTTVKECYILSTWAVISKFFKGKPIF